MISGIIKVSVSVISLSLRLRLITLTLTLIIPNITKTSSNNCLLYASIMILRYFCQYKVVLTSQCQGSSRRKQKLQIIFKEKAKMLITLSSLIDKTTLYSMKRSFLSKVNDKMSFKYLFVCLDGLFTSSCAMRALITPS